MNLQITQTPMWLSDNPRQLFREPSAPIPTPPSLSFFLLKFEASHAFSFQEQEKEKRWWLRADAKWRRRKMGEIKGIGARVCERGAVGASWWQRDSTSAMSRWVGFCCGYLWVLVSGWVGFDLWVFGFELGGWLNGLRWWGLGLSPGKCDSAGGGQ